MSQHFLLIGDVGGSRTYHVGDEGMLEANLDRLRDLSPQSRFTVISRDPGWTAETYDTEAIEPIGFPDATAEPQESEERLEALLGAATSGELASNFERRAQALGVIEAIRRADAVLISGGGNLNATWPEHLYERVALLALAECLHTPAVVLGQTIGPRLSEIQRRRLAESLRTSRLVGVRERGSYDLVRELGVPSEIIDYQLDDAIFLGRLFSGHDVPRPELRRPYLAVTLCGGMDGLEALASQVESLAETMKADVVFIPHAKEPDRDRELGARFGEALSTRARFHLLDVLPAREVAAITGNAEMVISTRYHPLVFAAATGVPSLGLSTDAYTHQKLSGTHAHAGLEDWVLPIELAVEGLLEPASTELWKERDRIRRHLAQMLPQWEAGLDLHWQRVAQALGLETEEARESRQSHPAAAKGIRPRGEWSRATAAYNRIKSRLDSKLSESRQHSEELLEVLAVRDEELASLRPALNRSSTEAASLRQTLDKRSEEVDSLKQVLEAREQEIRSLQETLQAREEELADLSPTLAARDRELGEVKSTLAAREEELDNLRPTLAAREEELDNLRPTLAAREEELRSINPVFAAREEELAHVHAKLAELRAELAQSAAELALIRDALARSEAKLSAYRNSFAGKVARKLGMSPEDRDN